MLATFFIALVIHIKYVAGAVRYGLKLKKVGKGRC
jgi:hypothetical protein